jgi:hypothetical protein
MLFICGGLMRTGSVAMHQVMREIVESTGLGYAPRMPMNREDEYFHENVGAWAASEEVVVAKLHRWRPDMADHKDGIRVAMTIRDMRDVVVSLMNFRQGTFESSLHSAAVTGNVDGQAQWEEEVPPGNMYKIRYEDFMADRAYVTMKVAELAGIKISVLQAQDIERRWNLAANLRRAAQGYSKNSPDYMAERHIHSGKSEQWRSALTPEQIEMVQDRVGHDWFKENGYELWVA